MIQEKVNCHLEIKHNFRMAAIFNLLLLLFTSDYGFIYHNKGLGCS